MSTDDPRLDELPSALATDDPEAPEADALEQSLPVDDVITVVESPFEADPADAADQLREAGFDDDEYP